MSPSEQRQLRGMPVDYWTAIFRHCSQAETSDAAAAQMAAQTPRDDNKTSSQKASLVRARATSYPDLSGCNGRRNGRRNSPGLLTGQTCRDMKLCSTSSSLDLKIGTGRWWPMNKTGDCDCHQTAPTLIPVSHCAVYCTSKCCPPRFSNRI